jgi:hypothetical protein
VPEGIGGDGSADRPPRRRGLFVAVSWSLAGAAILVAIVLAFAPLWVHLGPVRERVESAASSALGGRVTVARIDLSYFPRPGVVLHGLTLDAPGKVHGTIRSLGVSPLIPALLRGRFRPVTVRLDGPDLTVELPAPTPAKPPVSLSDPLKSLAPVLSAIATEVPGLTIEVNGERVAVARDGRTLAAVRGLRVHVGVSDGPAGRFHADVRLAAASVSLRREGFPSLEVGGLDVEGAVDEGDGRTAITLSRFSTDSPRFLAEIALSSDPALPRVELSARGSGLDVTALRRKILPVAGDDPTVAGIFGIVRGGTLTSFSFASGGTATADLGDFGRMSIRGVLAGGSVRIGSAGLDLEEARGDAAVEKSVLSVQNAAARIGRSRVSDGSLRLGLARGDDTLRVEAAVRADLAELPAILSRAIRSGSFRDELSGVTNLEGSATGRVTLENRRRGLETTVSVSELRLSGRLRRIPFPVTVETGTFFYDGNRVGVGRLSGSLGRTSVSGLSARLRTAGPPVIEAVSGRFEVALDELYPWLASGEGMEALRREIRRLTGSVGLSVARLSGPVSRPDEWQYEASGTLRDLALDVRFLPSSLEVKAGEFRIDPETIRVSGLEARTMDASLTVGGSLDGYRERLRKLDATVDGELGSEAVRWGWERFSLPSDFRPAAPLGLEKVRLGLDRAGALSLAGDLAVRNGPRVALDLAVNEDGPEIRRLAIADGQSNATLSLGLGRKELRAGLSGRLEAATLEALLARKRQRRGRLEGDFRIAVPRDHPGGATAEGWLKVSDLAVPTPAGDVRVEGLDLRASGGRLTAASSSLLLDEQRFSVTGSAGFRDDGFVLDLDAGADALAWERIEKVLDRMQKQEKKASAAGTPESGKGAATTEATQPEQPTAAFPRVLGEVHFALGAFSLGKLEWKPVVGSVRLEKETTGIVVRQADLCGIQTTGELRLPRGGEASLAARVASSGEDISVPLGCLGFSQARLTGRYEASFDGEAAGEGSDLGSRIRGPLSLRASNGRIAKANVLTRILDVLNLTNLFSGMARSTVGEALTYEELSIAGRLEGSRVVLEETTLKTPAFTMATTGEVDIRARTLSLTVLAHPFSTVDKIIGWIPVLRYVLGGDFASVGAKVTGTLDDPKVDLSPAKDVTQGLVNILGRTVKWPVHVVDPKGP